MILPRFLNLRIFQVFLLLLLALLSPLSAQNSGGQSRNPEASLSVEKLRKSIEEAEADGSLDAEAKAEVTRRLEEAISQLEAAAGFEAQAAALKIDITRGPGETASLRKELEQRKAGKIPDAAKEAADLPANADAAAIEAKVTAERTRVAELSRQARDWDSQFTELESRPSANRERIAAATRQLSEAEAGFAEWNGRAAGTSLEKSEFAREQSRILMLKAELAMLEQESLSFEVRRDLLQARRDLAESDLGFARERVSRLESRSGALVSERIGEAQRLIAELGLEAVNEDETLLEMVNQTRDLALGNQNLLARIAAAEAERNKAEEELERLRRESESIRAQIAIGGIEDSFSEIVLELRRTLPTAQSLRSEMSRRRQAISEARLEAFRTDRELEAMPSAEGQVEDLLDSFRAKGVGEEDLVKLRPVLIDFVSNRTTLRKDSSDANRRLATLLGETDLVTSERLALANELRDYLGERLVWAASAPPLGKNAFTGLRTAFLSLVGPDALREYGRTVARIHLGQWLLAGALAFVLLAPRKRLKERLAASSLAARRVSSDRISNTLSALLVSLWLALPFPALMGFFGWIFISNDVKAGAAYALGKAIMAPALLLLVLRFASVLCWPDGVAESHFRWKRSVLDPLHRGLVSLIFLYLPAHIILAVWWFNAGDFSAFQGPGRLVFIVAMFSLTLILRNFFRSNEGILSQLEPRSGTLRRLRRLWIAIALLIPVALAILAALGHFLSAVALAYLMQKTGVVIFGGILAYAILNRWASLKGRRMALADAIAQREAKRAAQETSRSEDGREGDSVPREEISVEVEEEEPVDWANVGEQTRLLIRAVVGLIVLLGCWLAWSEALPALKYLDSRNLFAEFSLSDLIWLGLIGVITGVIFQNLPGVLELGVLGDLELESGVRNAVITLCQYAVIAAGAALAFQTLGLDWSRFGWIAAALSVGLGFGLQEVVANFVSGLILLFERPIRVGDIVTVGGVDGVVTKIRIRATTITNWDKKEFIVPNKEFVTGTILNWTLSSPVTRLVFPVGIAYGSDIRKAQAILLEIARSQPEVLKEPEPAAVFERFGASTLDFSLRCYLARPEQRLEMTHRINTLIHDRFAAEGIEMSFQHHEIHLKSVDPSIRIGIGQETERK